MASTVVDDVSETGASEGELPFTVAVFTMVPASRSACVVAYVAVHVVEAPGARVATGQAIADRPASGSVTTIESSVTLPSFVTTNE